MQQYQYQQQYQYSPIKQPNFQQFYIPSPTETLVPILLLLQELEVQPIQ